MQAPGGLVYVSAKCKDGKVTQVKVKNVASFAGLLDQKIEVEGYEPLISNDAFLIKYASDGTKLWTKLLGTNGTDAGYGIQVGIDGSVYVASETGAQSGPDNARLTKLSENGFVVNESFFLSTDFEQWYEADENINTHDSYRQYCNLNTPNMIWGLTIKLK